MAALYAVKQELAIMSDLYLRIDRRRRARETTEAFHLAQYSSSMQADGLFNFSAVTLFLHCVTVVLLDYLNSFRRWPRRRCTRSFITANEITSYAMSSLQCLFRQPHRDFRFSYLQYSGTALFSLDFIRPVHLDDQADIVERTNDIVLAPLQ